MLLVREEGGVTGELVGAACQEDLTGQDVASILYPVSSAEEKWNACESSVTTARMP